MKILVNAQPLMDSAGGVRQYVFELVRHLQCSTEVETLMLRIGGALIECPDDLSVFDVMPIGTQHDISKSFGGLKSLIPLPIKQVVQDILLHGKLRGLQDFVYFEPNHILQNWLKRRVLTIHDLTVVSHPQYHPPERVRAFRQMTGSIYRADRIVTVSQYIKDSLLERFRLESDRVYVTHLGVSSPQATKRESAQNLKNLGIELGYVLLVGNIEPRKNIALFIQAVHKLLDAGVSIKVIHAGPDGWANDAEKAEISKLRSLGCWRSMGVVSNSRLSDLYNGALCLVFPSFDEGFGLPPLESMRHGTPSIVSDIPVHREVLSDAAIYCPPEGAGALADEIRKLLLNGAHRVEYSRRGERHARTFDWKRTTDATLEAIRSIA